jgi:hypothetical protein
MSIVNDPARRLPDTLGLLFPVAVACDVERTKMFHAFRAQPRNLAFATFS